MKDEPLLQRFNRPHTICSSGKRLFFILPSLNLYLKSLIRVYS